jgi:hypothetical protein
MQTTDDLNDQGHAVAIAKLQARVAGHDDAIEKLDERVSRHDEIIATLREGFGNVATKRDIADLRSDIGNKFDRQLGDAQNSIPGKVAAIFAGGMFLIALVTLVVSLVPHHG